MPCSVFDIVGIDGSVRLELLAALLVATGVIQRNTTLPKLRSLARREFCNAIEPCGRLGDASSLEVGDGAIERISRVIRARNGGRDHKERRKPGQAGKHCVHSLLRSR